MIKPLTLGNQSFPNNLIQGPLAGYSNAAFRRLTWQYSRPAFSCTEMISSKALLHQPKISFQRYIRKDPNEGPVCFQLSANDPDELAQATKMITDYGADLIDLNCGCPVNKIRRKGLGSSLLTNTTQLSKLIAAMRASTHLPISIKIRVEGNYEEKFNQEVAKVISDSGIDFLVVHGRHWNENYDIPCCYEQIEYFVDELKIPVIGNGDVSCSHSLKKMFATGCAGVMLSRAGVGQPWLIRQLIAQLENNQFKLPERNEIAETFLFHVNGLIEIFGSEKHAVLQARKFVKYYARGLQNKIDLLEATNNCISMEHLTSIIHHFFNQEASNLSPTF